MCGIVAGVAERSVLPILYEGLRRLEYRGYDSAGVAMVDQGEVSRARALGKLPNLKQKLQETPLKGRAGIAHTRWATHGKPSEANAHPHISGDIAIVHNGIIENYADLQVDLVDAGVNFESETDTEVVAHLLAKAVDELGDFDQAFRSVVKRLKGAFAIAAVHAKQPDALMVTRNGPPLVIGHGIGENFAASDIYALLPVTTEFTVLEDGDIACISRESVQTWDLSGEVVSRKSITSTQSNDNASKQGYKHFMLKEIHEHPEAVLQTIEGRLGQDHVLPGIMGYDEHGLLDKVKQIQIIACGTSSFAGMVARHWFEEIGIPAQVDIASEYRYRPVAMVEDTLVIGISQSGETADTLSALQYAKDKGAMGILAICNAPESSLTRLADLTLLTRAGREIGVASTKAFTAQLTALAIFATTLAELRGNGAIEEQFVEGLRGLPGAITEALALDKALDVWADKLLHKDNALFLGRGLHYPIAMEGALKLKEISYIHAEAYPSGELKHGPLALVDEDMPVIALAPQDDLLEKVLSSLREVESRGGELFILAGEGVSYEAHQSSQVHIIEMPSVNPLLSPIVYAVPLQLLSYKVALQRGTDVDQPRNLAKSVTVE